MGLYALECTAFKLGCASKYPHIWLQFTTKKESLSDALTSAATVVVGLLKGDTNVQSPSAKPSEALSPGRRARVSGQYIEHLERLKALKESGVLSDEEFKEQKTYALNNIRDLNK